MKPVKTAVEVEAVLKTEYRKKLVVDDKKIPDPFKYLMVGRLRKNKWYFGPILYPDIIS